MPEPVSTTAAVISAIEAGAAVVGVVSATHEMASADSGFNVGRCHVHYPKEFPADQFAHGGQVVGWDIMKFVADGYLWNNYLTVYASGYLSNDNSELLGRPGTDHPHTPVNRFMILTFDKSGTSENMSGGLLNLNIEPWAGDAQIAEGNAHDPWLALKVHGRFDPRGFGDKQFSFKLGINSFGSLHLSGETHSGSGSMSFENKGDHILVTLDQ